MINIWNLGSKWQIGVKYKDEICAELYLKLWFESDWYFCNITESLSETKTRLIRFRSPWKHLPCEPDIRINNYKLKLHSHIKYLGILIDEVLSWNKQIDDICTKLARANGILSKLHHLYLKNMCINIFLFVLLSCPFWLFGLVLLNPT